MKLFFFPGGRGEDSSVIITLPEYSAFSDIPEESLAKVLTYLTLIPRWVNQRNTLPPTINLSSPLSHLITFSAMQCVPALVQS